MPKPKKKVKHEITEYDVLDLNAQLKPLIEFPLYTEWLKDNPNSNKTEWLREKIVFEKEMKEANEVHKKAWEKRKPKTLEEWENEQGLKEHKEASES